MTLTWIRPWRTLLIFYPVFFPFVIFALLWLRGLPSAAQPFPLIALGWVIGVTWIPAVFTGILLTALVMWLRPYLYYFTQPYDFGRSFSLGAIFGGVLQAMCTGLYRAMGHPPLSNSWIAGGTIAGCITGAIATALFFWHWSIQKPVIPKPRPLPTDSSIRR